MPAVRSGGTGAGWKTSSRCSAPRVRRSSRSWRLPAGGAGPLVYPSSRSSTGDERGYAREIAERWNVKECGSGFVTRLAVRKAFLTRYEPHVVGAREHEEYWIPAEELDAFNDAIVGEIEVIASFGSAGKAELRPGREWFEAYCDILDNRSVVREPSAGVRHACPCCHHRTLDMRSGFEICPVCFWEDDGQDDHDADAVRGGPNGRLSLTVARANYARLRACDEGSLRFVRAPLPSESRHTDE